MFSIKRRLRTIFGQWTTTTVRRVAKPTLESLESRLAPATLHWTGTTNNLWSVASNWLENATPADGDGLVFDTTVQGFAGRFASQNDITGLDNLTIRITDTSSAGDFAFTGSAMSLAPAGITNTTTSGTGTTVNNNLTLVGNTSLNSFLGTLDLRGVISGNAALNADGGPSGTVHLSGANTYTGGVVLASGTVHAANATALGSGRLTLAGGTLTSSADLSNPFTVAAPSTTDGLGFRILGAGILNATLTTLQTGALTLSGALSGPGGLIQHSFTGSITLAGTQPNTFTGGITVDAGEITLQKTAGVDALVSPITLLAGSAKLTLAASNQMNGKADIILFPGTTLEAAAFTDTIRSINGIGGTVRTGTGAGLTVTGAGTQRFDGTVAGSAPLRVNNSTATLRLTGPSSGFTGALVAQAGTLAVDGNFSGATAQAIGGILAGVGTIKSFSATSGVLSPGGTSAGSLTTSASSSSSLNGVTFRVDLDDVPRDKLLIGTNGSVSLNGCTLSLNALGTSFADVYTIVSSLNGSIADTFVGLADNASVLVGGQDFRINYTGKAVTLTNLANASPTNLRRWTGAVSSAWSAPGNWLENIAPGNNSMLVFDTTTTGFPATAASFAPRNDMGDLTGISITINDNSSAGDFAITGNFFSLSTAGVQSNVAVGTSATISNNLTILIDGGLMNAAQGILNLNGVIAGGTLINQSNPNASVVLKATNTYSGGTVLNSGILVHDDGALPAVVTGLLGSGPITFNGGTLSIDAFDRVPNSFVVNAPSAIAGGGVDSKMTGNGVLNADLTSLHTGFLYFEGGLSGPEGLIQYGFPGSITLSGSQPNTFAGGINILYGGVTLDKTPGVDAVVSPISLLRTFASLDVKANNQLNGKADLIIGEGADVKLGSAVSDQVRSIRGTGSLSIGSTGGLRISGNSTVSTFNGVLSGSAPLTLTGTGSVLSLGGKSPSFTGDLIVQAGTLDVAGDLSKAAARPATGGSLRGRGLVQLINPTGGTIQPGGTSTGILNTSSTAVSSSLTGTTLEVNLSNPAASDTLVVGNTATLDIANATLRFQTVSSATGNVYSLITLATGGISGTFNGLPDGTTLIGGAREFRINYTANAVTLTDLGAAATLSVTDVTVSEGAGTATFTVTLSPASAQTITVDYATTNGTAIGGSDYSSTSGLLTFAPGETTKTFVVAITSDTRDEPDETFNVTLSNPTNAVLGTAAAIGTISDDDFTPSLSIANVSASEGVGNMMVTVTLSEASGRIVTVDYATATGTATISDFTNVTGTLTFAPGITTQTFNVPILNDALAEADETFSLTISNATNATLDIATATGTINDNDGIGGVKLSISPVSVSEGAGQAVFTVSLSAANSQTVTVNYATSNGTAVTVSDYTSTSGSLTFPVGVVNQRIFVPIKNDVRNEAEETFMVTLSGATNAKIDTPTATGTITDDDPVPSLSVANVSAAESANSMTFTVTLSASSSQTITVDYATSDGTASGSDFGSSSGTLTFAPGVTTQTFVVPLTPDALDETDETFTITLSGETNATINTPTATGTITDDDPTPSLSIANASATENISGMSFTVTLSAVSGRTVTVNYATTAGTAAANSDFTTTNSSVSFAPGQTTRTITIPVTNDLLDEVDETFTLTLSGASGATISTATATATIKDDDATPTLSVGDVVVPEGNAGTINANFTVVLSAPSGLQVTVNFATSNDTAIVGSDFASKIGGLTFAPGETTKTVTVGVFGELTYETTEKFNLTLSGAKNATVARNAVGTITNDDLGIARADAFVMGKGTLSVPAPGLLGNDPTIGSATVRLVNSTTNGQLSLNPNGSFVYTPNPNFAGIDSFRYAFVDSIGVSQPTVVNISVGTGTSLLPVNDSFTVRANALNARLDVRANDPTPPGAGAPAPVGSVSTGSAGGTIRTDGSTVIYSPAPGFVGTETFNYTVGLNGQSATATVSVRVTPPSVPGILGVASTPAGSGRVRTLSSTTLAAVQEFTPFPGFQGGFELASGDVNADGVADTLVGTANAAGHLKVFSGTTGDVLFSLLPFAGYRGGLDVAVGDINADGFADMIVAATNSHIRVLSGANGAVLRNFIAFASFAGNVTVAAGDTNADGYADIVVVANGAGGNGHIKVFDGNSPAELSSFFGFLGYTGKLALAVGDLDGDGRGEIIANALNPVRGNHTKIFSGATERASFIAPLAVAKGVPDPTTALASIAAVDRNGDNKIDLVFLEGSLEGLQLLSLKGDDLSLLDRNIFV